MPINKIFAILMIAIEKRSEDLYKVADELRDGVFSDAEFNALFKRACIEIGAI